MLEENIIKKCIQGDRVAQGNLYSFYASRTYGICIRYAGSSFEAEDILQDAFIKIFNRLGSFNMDGSFDGWIKRIVINTAIDHYNANAKKNNHIHLELLKDYDLEYVPETTDLHEEDLLNMLSKLPHGYKMVFNLYAIEGFSHKEIATMLNITEGTSKSQLSKARRHLQSLLHINNIA